MKNPKKEKPPVCNVVSDFMKQYYVPSSEDNINIKEVWDGRYRVNVWCNSDERTYIKDSFFIKVRDKEVVFCDPPLNLGTGYGEVYSTHRASGIYNQSL